MNLKKFDMKFQVKKKTQNKCWKLKNCIIYSQKSTRLKKIQRKNQTTKF